MQRETLLRQHRMHHLWRGLDNISSAKGKTYGPSNTYVEERHAAAAGATDTSDTPKYVAKHVTMASKCPTTPNNAL